MGHYSILYGTYKASIVDTMMAVETLVLCIDKSLPEYRVYILVCYSSAVLVKVLANEHAICTVNLGSLVCLRVHNGIDSSRLSE